MIKAILGIVVGYLALLLFFFGVFTGLYVLLGAERVFQPMTYEVSTLWMMLGTKRSARTGAEIT